MANPKSPGVYIQEIPKLPASVAEVGTAIPAFIGYTQNHPSALDKLPKRITSLLEYEEVFGGPFTEQFTVTITDTYDTNDEVKTRTFSVASPSTVSKYKMYYQLQMYFANGGGPCYIVSVGAYANASSTIDKTKLMEGIKALETADEPTLLVFPDDMSIADYKVVYDEALASCAKLQDRFTIMDVKVETGDAIDDAIAFRNDGIGIGNLKYGAAYYPKVKTVLTYGIKDSAITVTHLPATKPNTSSDNFTDLEDVKTGAPNIYRSIMEEINKSTLTLAPSGAIAGVYARVDSERGVWKAPANVDLRYVLAPTVSVTSEEQELLNIDATSGKSINAIRSFTGKGTLVWGSRTLAGNDNEWRYVPVRRFFNFAEESIKKATEFVVFEPNDANTWLRTKAMIENFLTTQWRAGALAGAKPEDAFYVSVGLGSTMTALDILEGRMNIEIGMAVVRPAEFIILKFSHKLQQS